MSLAELEARGQTEGRPQGIQSFPGALEKPVRHSPSLTSQQPSGIQVGKLRLGELDQKLSSVSAGLLPHTGVVSSSPAAVLPAHSVAGCDRSL